MSEILKEEDLKIAPYMKTEHLKFGDTIFRDSIFEFLKNKDRQLVKEFVFVLLKNMIEKAKNLPSTERYYAIAMLFDKEDVLFEKKFPELKDRAKILCEKVKNMDRFRPFSLKIKMLFLKLKEEKNPKKKAYMLMAIEEILNNAEKIDFEKLFESLEFAEKEQKKRIVGSKEENFSIETGLKLENNSDSVKELTTTQNKYAYAIPQAFSEKDVLNSDIVKYLKSIGYDLVKIDSNRFKNDRIQ